MDNVYSFFVVPEALISDANQLAMVVAYGPADELTFGLPNCVGGDGNLYQARNIWAPDTLFSVLQAPLVRPEWDTEDYIDMVAAERAQAALVFSTEPVAADPAHLTAIGAMEGVEALAAMGLTLIEVE